MFRGATIAAMLLVNNPGSWDPAASHPQLRHALWNGWTLTDLVFPFFLFAAGLSLEFSLARRSRAGAGTAALLSHAGARAVALVLLGLLQARFPLLERHPRGLTAAIAAAGAGGVLLRAAVVGGTVALVGALVAERGRRGWLLALACAVVAGIAGALSAAPDDRHWLIQHLLGARVPGVLQRIGVCVFLAACLTVARPGSRWLGAWIGLLLLGSALWTVAVPIPGFGPPDLSQPAQAAAGGPATPFSNWCMWLDTRIFGDHCLQSFHDPATGTLVWSFDPEGAGSTAGALVTVLMGAAAARWLRPRLSRTRLVVGGLLGGGVVALALGAALDLWIPINKQLWTASYAVFTAGCACAGLALCVQLCAAPPPARAVAAPFVWYGRNALALFLGSSLAATLAVHLRVADASTGRLVPFKAWVYARLCEQLSPRDASLVHALAVVVIWAAVAGVLARRRIFLKL